LLDLSHEQFWVLLLNRANEVIRPFQISIGGVAGTIADPKLIFKSAIEHLASALILVHNHPSGNRMPSQADKDLTKKVKEAGRLLEIPILDHLIFTDNAYFSFADEGIL
jgi:DNA repair protein RadC